MKKRLVMILASMVVFSGLLYAGAFEVIEEQGVVRVKLDDELFTEYHYEAADRPYFYPVIAPTGDNITRHWPMRDINPDEAKDHRHHRSLWFTHGDVNGQDFWVEGKGPKIVQTMLEVKSAGDEAVIISGNEWRKKDGRVVCTDLRKHTIRTAGDSRMIDFEITLKASHGKLTLGATKEGAMAVRVTPTLRARGKVAQGRMLNSEGVQGKDCWGKKADWCDYSGPVNGKMVGVTIMAHPENPSHPTWWHARDYGLCTANPFMKSKMEIADGESLTFKFRVFIHNGTAEEVDVVKAYGDYVGGGSLASGSKMDSIFNGRDFSGWKIPENNAWWKVEDGIIKCQSGPKKKGSIIWTEKKYRDFVVEYDFKFGEGTIDSGLFLRTKKQQVQLGFSGSKKRDMTGSVYVPGSGYPLEAEGVMALLKPKDWNRMKIKVVGEVYAISLNGKAVLVYDDQTGKAVEEGPIGFQLHPGRNMAIDFRNIRIREL